MNPHVNNLIVAIEFHARSYHSCPACGTAHECQTDDVVLTTLGSIAALKRVPAKRPAAPGFHQFDDNAPRRGL